jgi:hypothetical protein
MGPVTAVRKNPFGVVVHFDVTFGCLSFQDGNM